MTKVIVPLETAVIQFYQKIAEANNLPLEQVLSDALFKLAGELSLQAIRSPYIKP